MPRQVKSVLVFVLLIALHAGGMSKGAIAVPPLPEMEQTWAPGMKMTIQAFNGTAIDVRESRLVALRVEAGQAPSPFVAPGQFKATWDGAILLRIKGDYTFSALGNGAVKVTVDDQPALEVSGDSLSVKSGPVVKLKKGKNVLHVEYTSPANGPAELRLRWSAHEFAPEPLSPTVLVHDASDQPLREQARVRRGRELVASGRCLKCHVDEMATSRERERADDSNGSLTVAAGVAGMPELESDTPSLENVARRDTQVWLAHWINNPRAIRPDAEMPNVLGTSGNGVDQRAKDIAAYLVSTSAKTQAANDASDPDDIAKGAHLYTDLGCVACHVLPGETDVPTDLPTLKISLKFAPQKFQPGALKAFLLEPEKHYRWIRMPDFRLTDSEATALAAFIRSRKSPELSQGVQGDPAKGKQLFESSGCLNCHSMKLQNQSKAPSLAAVLKSDWTHGCMAKDAQSRGAAPDYAFSDDQRASLLALAATDFLSLRQDAPAEFAQRQIKALNCLACHPRDKEDDTWSGLKDTEVAQILKEFPKNPAAQAEIMGDQVRPPLTWTGEKLRGQWMSRFIGGKIPYKPRPWLAARMPGFVARADLLSQGLSAEHGLPPIDPPHEKPNPALAAVGRKLAGKVGGFSCVQCHSVGDQKAFAPFEAPAINFMYVSDRLRREFYDRWVWNPQRVLPGTRMPSFADYEGKTALKDEFDGDAHKQFDAIWNYILSGRDIQPPAQ
jgi:cytochrome c2